MKYPGKSIKKGEADKNVVKAIQKRLNEKGYGPIIVDGDFGAITQSVVKLFQSQNTDQLGNPLLADGIIGAISWAVLFGDSSVKVSTNIQKKLTFRAVEMATNQIGVREKGGNNCGPEVEAYLKSVGLGKGHAWCMAFVYWCFEQASKELNLSNPLVKTGGVLKGWNEAKCGKIKSIDAMSDISLVKPGQIFIIDHGKGYGHTGLIKEVNGGFISTIEGNTNNNKTREGIGVFELTRKVKDINKGFLQY